MSASLLVSSYPGDHRVPDTAVLACSVSWPRSQALAERGRGGGEWRPWYTPVAQAQEFTEKGQVNVSMNVSHVTGSSTEAVYSHI